MRLPRPKQQYGISFDQMAALPAIPTLTDTADLP
jgi:hypothetical protein